MPTIHALLGLLASAHACTTVVVNSTDGATVIGRTMELGPPVPKKLADELWRIVTLPRGAAVGPETSRYGAVMISAAANRTSFAAEGMNEAGLTVSVQTLHQASYETAEARGAPAMAYSDVAAYLLGACQTVGDVDAALRRVTVVDAPAFAGIFGRCHWIVADAAGGNVVVEYLAGAPRTIHDNARVGVATNDPDYEWHLRNLNNYAAYPTARDEPGWGLDAVQTAVGAVPSVPGHGLNTRGLPAGTTPPDRFVKMFLLRETAAANAPPATVDDAIVLATGLLNTVHLVQGTVARISSLDGLEWTNWAVIKIPAERRFLVRTYSDLGWRNVDFTQTHEPLVLYDALGPVRDFTPGRAE